MVAVIKTGHSIHRILNYNENKVKEGVAECIGQGNYPIDFDKMTITMKLNRFLKHLELNENVTRNSVHISLNFHPGESHLDNGKLIEIADAYMKKIGFGAQPFLVYRHYDSGHPHIHLVSIKVRPDGSRIDMNNIGRNQSQVARKEIEKTFGLIEAEGVRSKLEYALEPVIMGKVKYGRIQSKKALTTVLDNVLPNYKYTSLPELNAVLRQYNVLADRGSENSRVFKANGLVYRILDDAGNPVGVPIKASDFYNRPTLKVLEEKFNGNVVKRLPHKGRVKNAVDLALLGGKTGFQDLIKMLENQGIHVAVRQNDNGLIYGLTYVDHTTRCVFNGSALGKTYSAKGILERCLHQGLPGQHPASHADLKKTGLQPQANAATAATSDAGISEVGANFLEALMQPEFVSDFVPSALKNKRNKKKRKGKKQ